MIWIDEPVDSAGPASTSKPSNDGAWNDPLSGLALSANSTRNAPPTETVSGELASKVTSSSAKAGKTTNAKNAASDNFAKKTLMYFIR